VEDRWEGGNFIFTEPSGKWTYIDDVTARWKSFLERHMLPTMTFHGLRHTAATLWLGALPLVDASRILGHGQPSTTSNMYGHKQDDTHALAAQVMASLSP
jgi:integrase